MAIHNPSGPSAYDNDPDYDTFLERYDVYIINLAWKKVPRNIIRPEVLRDEIEELAQRVRIKLWRALQKRHIVNPKSYISHMMLSEVIDMVRRYHPVLSLSFDEDGELYKDGIIDTSGEGIQDLVCEIEQEEAFHESVQASCEALLELPPRQQYAMICALKDHIDDVLPLIEMLRHNQINIDEINWPGEKSELQRLRASLSVARKKLNSSNRKGE